MWEIISTIIALAMMANATGDKLNCVEDFSVCSVGEITVSIENDEISSDDRWAIVASVYISTRHNFQTANYYNQVWWNWHFGMITADDAAANVGFRPELE